MMRKSNSHSLLRFLNKTLKKKKKGKKDYFKNGKFFLSRELIDRIPCISSVSHSTYGINYNGEIICWGKEDSSQKVISGLENETIVAISPTYSTCLFASASNKVFYRVNKF